MTAKPPMFTNPNVVHEQLSPLRQALNSTLLGKENVVELVLACLLARGHLLLEDLPGLGKTTLAKALADAVGGSFARVQCTPDLLPGDITGFSVFNQQTRQFEFRRGPAFAEVLLADEINRATPRTQSALLEAMAERQVTVDGQCYELSPASLVIATQNPVEHHGTYPLPEAQLDRFTMKLSIGYPAAEHEEQMLARAIMSDAPHTTTDSRSVLQPGELAALHHAVARVAVAVKVRQYLIALAQATRQDSRINLGLSPRGLLTWQAVAQAWAFLAGRSFVTPDDIQDVAHPVLSVRLGIEPDQAKPVIEQLLESIPVPI